MLRIARALVRRLFYLASLVYEWVFCYSRSARQGETIFRSKGYHVFFGYYDVSPFGFDGQRVLATRVGLSLKTPAVDRVMEVGYFNLSVPDQFISIAETTAWCWQQGCRLQWYPANQESNQVFYNYYANGKYSGVIRDLDTGTVTKTTSLPLYDISKDGAWGLSLDFSRLQRLRPGYGYSAVADATQGELLPAEGGVILYEITTDVASVIVSYSSLIEFESVESMVGAEHYLNHLSFSPSGDGFVFFHFWMSKGKRHSRLLWVERHTGEMTLVNNSGRVSHYAWETDKSLLVYCALSAGLPMHYYQYDFSHPSSVPSVVGKDVLKVDGHPTIIDSGKRILTDTYPDQWSRQTLMLYSISGQSIEWSRRFFRSKKFTGELRADLHPRVDRKQNVACIDDEARGERVMRIIPLGKASFESSGGRK